MHHGEKLKIELKRQKITQEELAERIGISRNYLIVLTKEYRLKGDYKEKIIAALNLKSDFFEDEDVNTYVNNNLVKEPIPKYIKKTAGIPYYDVDVSASQVEMFNDKKEIPNLHYNIPGFEDCDFAVPVFGHSMYPTYENGTVIMCKKINDKTLIIFGEAYLIVTKDYRMVKRLQRSELVGYVVACSDNEEERNAKGQRKYEPVDVPVDKILHLYLIKGVIKRNQL